MIDTVNWCRAAQSRVLAPRYLTPPNQDIIACCPVTGTPNWFCFQQLSKQQTAIEWQNINFI